MLQLDRKINEDVIIRTAGGETIIIRLLSVTMAQYGCSASLGFDAPRSVQIDRREIRERRASERDQQPAGVR